jgi:hypothetical protein
MAWLWWRQHRADRAEMLAIRHYLDRRAAQRQFPESISDARRHDDAIIRLDTELGTARSADPTQAAAPTSSYPAYLSNGEPR